MSGIIGNIDGGYQLDFDGVIYWVATGYLEEAGKFLNENPNPKAPELPWYIRLISKN